MDDLDFKSIARKVQVDRHGEELVEKVEKGEVNPITLMFDQSELLKMCEALKDA